MNAARLVLLTLAFTVVVPVATSTLGLDALQRTAPADAPYTLSTSTAPAPQLRDFAASAPAAAGNEPFGITFHCPFNAGVSQDLQAQVDNAACPEYVIDAEDLLGQPVLAVDPYNPNIIAFSALHGGHGLPSPTDPLGPAPPTARSRYDVLHQPHTTFQTGDGGANWIDQRYYSTDALKDANRTIYGEDNALTLDAQGRGYIASLYSWHDQGEKAWHWSVTVYKTQRLNRPVSYDENYMILHKDGAESNNTLSDLHLTYSRDTNRVVVFWLETAVANTTGPGGKTSWIQAHYTVPGEGAKWERLPAVEAVGPCRAMADPIELHGTIFFGCLPAKGYQQSNGTLDAWQIHALDTKTLRTSYIGPTSMGTLHARLVDMAQTGHMILIGSGIEGGGPVVRTSLGVLGHSWSDPVDYARNYRLLPAESKTTYADARITAAAYTKETGYLHTVYQERYAAATDANKLIDKEPRSFNKTYAVLRPINGRFEGAFNQLHFGRPVTAAQAGPAFTGIGDAIFDDLHDGIVVWHDPKTAKERIFTVFGDYGAARFAEVREENAIPVPPLPPIELIGIPLAAASSSASSTGAVVGAISLLMLLRMLLAKNKTVAKAPTL